MMPFIQLGTFQIPTYPLAYALAFALFGAQAITGLGRLPLGEKYQRGVALTMVAALAGLYLPGLFEAIIRSLATGRPAEISPMRVYYALGAGILTAVVYYRAHRLNIWLALDRLVTYFALAFSVARLGCLAAGCCGGAETASGWGMYAPDDAGHWANRYPTQLISFGMQLALFLFFSWLLRWQAGHQNDLAFPGWLRRPGMISFAYLLLFCVERLVLDFLRYDYSPIWGPFSLPQLLMIASLAALVFGLVKMLQARSAL
jgi:phosphatidylglycerol:prolipoprotein diacylglycerol transferase